MKELIGRMGKNRMMTKDVGIGDKEHRMNRRIFEDKV